ncbi:MAG: GTPase [Acidimicrobiales bacterium]
MTMSPRVGATLTERVNALESAVGLARGKAPDTVVNAADEAVLRARRRIGHGTPFTIVALAGPTGAGKSSLFNALAGAELADVDVAPSADRAHACVWGPGGDELLDILRIDFRHHVDAEPDLDGLLLIDLPDLEAREIDPATIERLIDFADLTVWVLDPDGYSDAEFHRSYIRPLARYGDVMRFLFNKSDRIDHQDGIDGATNELCALIGRHGIEGAVVLPTSSQTVAGTANARALLVDVVAERGRTLAEVDELLRGAASALTTTGGLAGMGSQVRADLIERMGSAIGLTTSGEIAAQQYVHDGALATGWPPLRLYRRYFPANKPLLGSAERQNVIVSEVDAAVRVAGDRCAEGLTPPWDDLVHEAAVANLDDVIDALELVSLRTSRVHKRKPEWWTWLGWAQKICWAMTLVGLLWMGLAGLVELTGGDGSSVAPGSGVGTLRLPGLMALVGAFGGVLLGLGSLVRIKRRAAHKAKQTRGHLRRGVADIAQSEVVRPIDAVLSDHAQLERLLAQAAPGEKVVRRSRRSRQSATA